MAGVDAEMECGHLVCLHWNPEDKTSVGGFWEGFPFAPCYDCSELEPGMVTELCQLTLRLVVNWTDCLTEPAIPVDGLLIRPVILEPITTPVLS